MLAMRHLPMRHLRCTSIMCVTPELEASMRTRVVMPMSAPIVYVVPEPSLLIATA